MRTFPAPSEVVTLDFETYGIESRPDYPPKPVGLGVKHGGEASKYFRWGHPNENNCEEHEVRKLLSNVYSSGAPVLFQNAKFDCDVAEVHWGLQVPPWQQVHDSMYLIYLYDPHALSLSLKPSAERILGEPPDEQDRLRDWVLSNVSGATKKSWGAYIAYGPGGLVGEYACGDVDRTWRLYCHLLEHVETNRMEDAYNRERRLMPCLLQSERHGIRLDQERLEQDHSMFQGVVEDVDDMIRRELNAGVSMNPGSGRELADALERSGRVGSKGFINTPTGARSTSQESLRQAIEDEELLHLLAYRGALKTLFGTFMDPWVQKGKAANGRLHTNWNQTRNDGGKGTRTGRISSNNPNFTNVPNPLDLPEKFLAKKWLPQLPHMRSYLLPDEGHVWIKRDYSSQEVRILGHYEDGPLMQRYNDNPLYDPHAGASDDIRTTTGHVLPRSSTKAIAFSILYGSGGPHLSKVLECELHEAYALKRIYLGAMPGVRELMDDVKLRGKRRMPVRTLGGRVLYAEQPYKGRDFSYKLLNHLIQGSAADATKEALCEWYEGSSPESVLMAQVYDEVNVSAPADDWHRHMLELRDHMEAVPCDVILLSEGYQGANWSEADGNKIKESRNL